MSYLIAIKRTDGGVSIMRFVKTYEELLVEYCKELLVESKEIAPDEVYNKKLVLDPNAVNPLDVYNWRAKQLVPKWQEAVTKEDGEKLFTLESYRVVEEAKIPTDRTFRDAWTDDFDTDTVDVCMGTAKQLHMDNIRQARAVKFVELGFPNRLDSDLENAIIPEATRNKLQTLRDIPQNIDLGVATTPEELKSIWPEELE